MNVTEITPDQKELSKVRIFNRFIAKAVDFIIIGVLYEVIPKIGFFAGLVYLLIADGLFEGRSVGKRLIKLKVVLHETGQQCGVKESIIRNFPLAIGYVLYCIIKIPIIRHIFPLLIIVFEFLLILGSEKGMRLGDELARTQVVEEIPTESTSADQDTSS
jgi:uncharacterized RDD family membrane protein YckC